MGHLLCIHSVNMHGDRVPSVVSSAGDIQGTEDTIPALQEGAHGFAPDPPTLTFLGAGTALAKAAQDTASSREGSAQGQNVHAKEGGEVAEQAAGQHPSPCPQSGANHALAGAAQFNDNAVPSAAAASQEASFRPGHPWWQGMCFSCLGVMR